MRRTACLLVAVALVDGGAPSRAALAQSPADVATRWGLLGSWAADCGTPPSRQNSWLIFAIKGGTLYLDREFGDVSDITRNQVMTASIRPDKAIALVISYPTIKPPQTREILFAGDADGRIHTVSNKRLDSSDYSIKDGIWVANGQPSSRLTRCR